jgi:Tol biopolymer transport system component
MRYILMPVLVFLASVASAQLGQFTGYTHVGNPVAAGKIVNDAGAQTYTLEGASSNMWFARDDFHFLWKRIKGDFILTADFSWQSAGVDPHRKVGWMVRHSLEPNSPHANAVVHGDGLSSLQFRRLPGADTEELKASARGADVIRLERAGKKYTVSFARFGKPFGEPISMDLELGDEVYVGLFLCSHNEQAVEKATFRNVRLVIPPWEGFVPYRDYLGSHLELLDLSTNNRQVLYSEPGSFQAPNWTVDGKALIYNRDGLLYKFDLQSNTPAVINTDFANRNNNDHVISFDGKMLAISHHSEQDSGQSILYTLPIDGGKPFRVTPLGPSYLHGWSPDGKYLVYVGSRGDDYDIYRIPARGGKEVRLTTTKGLDDGPEYSPDGKYIYFNSVRSGTMQLWRMRPDGTKPEQLTNDEFNNWFPHISPDGKWIVFISYGQDVAPGDHPFYKKVYLRKMPVSGGKPEVIAYVFGGQGTINVPSWSPDGKKIAFVSNTKLD